MEVGVGLLASHGSGSRCGLLGEEARGELGEGDVDGELVHRREEEDRATHGAARVVIDAAPKARRAEGVAARGGHGVHEQLGADVGIQILLHVRADGDAVQFQPPGRDARLDRGRDGRGFVRASRIGSSTFRHVRQGTAAAE